MSVGGYPIIWKNVRFPVYIVTIKYVATLGAHGRLRRLNLITTENTLSPYPSGVNTRGSSMYLYLIPLTPGRNIVKMVPYRERHPDV